MPVDRRYHSLWYSPTMLKVSLFLFALVVAALGAPANDEVGSWIVGGSNAGATEAPYQVSLRSTNNNHFCGGSILNARTIVTAAHCVVGTSASSVIVVVGTTTLNSGGTRYAVSRITVHPNYNSNTIVNDVAVVITSTSISGASNVASINLATSDVGAGASLKLTGWGTTSYPGSAPNNLQVITLTSLSVSDCQSKLSGVGSVFATQICTLTRAGEGACHGDSGGPLVGGGQLVGIVSWGYPCARGYPDVFTRVSSFASWINQNAQN